ncbi:MAG: DegT/DnrJ/EryC1/StrS family aminotransferase, partial [Bryobacter sp.]|nr:DegT/DnrJ/EryC1/StrS family aminotransferase [Bryobacter sp.]
MQLPPWPVAGDRELELLREVLSSPQWGGFHPIVPRFEKMFAEYQHCAHAISAVNGTVTLEMGLQASGIGDGAEVIVPCISFVATATAVSRMRAVPVFVDIEPYSFNIDPAQIERAISPRTKAILAVHFGGPMANMDAILDIGRRHGIPVFEDAAHAHGSEWNGRRAGSLGAWASFSFQNGKVLTAGEGG